MKKKKHKNKLKWRTIQIKVPVCPECNANMKDKDGVYKCTKCAYKHII